MKSIRTDSLPLPTASPSGFADRWLWPRPLHAGALVVAPSLFAIGQALDDTSPADGVSGYLLKVADHRSLYLAAGLCLLASFMLFIPAAAALVRRSSTQPRAAWLRTGAIALGAGTTLGLLPMALSFGVGYLLADPRFADVPPDVVEAVFAGMNGSPLALVGGVGALLGQGLGCIFIAIGLWRSRLAPRWAALLPVLLPVSWFVFGALTLSLPWGVKALPGALLAIACAMVAFRWLRVPSSR
jgi:hypothetical protein